MTKDIPTALAPLLKIWLFCGLGYLEYPFKRSRPYCIYLYFFIKWSLYSYLFYYLIYTSHTAFVYFTLLGKLDIFVTIVSTLFNLLHCKELKMCLHKLSIVDDTLNVLETPKDYQWLHKLTIRAIIIWIILICLMDIVDSVWLNFEYFSITRLFVPFVASHIYHINYLISIMWGIILRYIAFRFQRINEHLKNLLKDDIKNARQENLILSEGYEKSQRRIKTNEIKERSQFMWIIMHVHLQLCLISRNVNKIFSMQMTLQMASFFIAVIDNCCLIYTSLLTNTATFGQVLDGSFNYLWAVTNNIKFLTLNYVCQIVNEQATEAIVILYKLSDSSPDKDLREQILQFILQIKQREVKFSGMRLFYFGNNLIRRFYTSVLSVMVIIIQMHITYKYDDINSSTETIEQ